MVLLPKPLGQMSASALKQ